MKKLLLMLLALALMLTPFTALAAEKVTEYDAAALIEDTAAEGSVNVYHWWTAGGEKDAIESVISGFQAAYPSSQAKSNAIPGGAGGAMVMKVKVLQQAGKSPESFQAHPGEEIQPYLDADMLLDLSAVWEYAGLEERVLPASLICARRRTASITSCRWACTRPTPSSTTSTCLKNTASN